MLEKMELKAQARKLYEHNKNYVQVNINRLTWQECSAFQKKQNELYLIYSA